MIDDLYKFEMEKYMIMWKTLKIKNEFWGEINGMIYNLVLQHCPKVLESLLKSQTRWDTISNETEGVEILLIVRDITHKHDSYMTSTLSYVKTFFEWTLTFQGKHKSNTDYYMLFLSRIKKTRLHGGERVFHNDVYQTHLAKLLSNNNLATLEFIGIGSSKEDLTKRKELEKTARELAWEFF